VTIPLKKGSQFHTNGMRLDIVDIAETQDEFRASYSLSWPPGVSTATIDRRRRLLKMLQAGGTLSSEDERWMNASENRITVMGLHDFCIPSETDDTPYTMELSQRYSTDLARPGITGQIIITKKLRHEDSVLRSLKLRIVQTESVKRKFRFRVKAFAGKVE